MSLNAPGTGDDTAKPAMWIDANVHGNEIQGTEIVLYTLWMLASAYGSNEALTQLLDEKSFYLLPSQNPDVQSLLYWRGMLIVIAWGAVADGKRVAQQCVGRHGRLPLTPTATNVCGDAASQLDLTYNPSTSRLELLQLQTADGRACLQQWSLPPHEMTAGSGEWRDDGEICFTGDRIRPSNCHHRRPFIQLRPTAPPARGAFPRSMSPARAPC